MSFEFRNIFYYLNSNIEYMFQVDSASNIVRPHNCQAPD